MAAEVNQETTAKSVLEELIKRRRPLVEALDANEGEVNLDIFEDFYPDRAHFVFELLQNAEDAGATRVTFILKPDRLICEHDGRKFTAEDVTAITGIHNSTKKGAPDRIGKFGVGFKSVFVYTQSPTVRSGDFSFRIVRLILPEPIERDLSLASRTRFEFPFDNPKKPVEEAYEEIAAGLKDLDETTLLFLSSLQAIGWHADENETGAILRRKHSDSHFEVLKQRGSTTTSSLHFLKFDQTVPGFTAQKVAIAFPLEFLTGVREFDPKKPFSEQFKIVPAAPGRVAVFFTATRETSGLLFHLHAPFVPELSRASIKETAANAPLFEQLAKLSAQSLHEIRDMGLLTAGFLEVLPNPQDQIPERYEPIREAIITEMKTRPLTPTQARGHAAASRLVQAKASLKDLVSEEDLEFLIEYDDEPPLWAVAATQRNSRIDNFLNGLKIQDWGIDEFVETLQDKADTKQRYRKVAPYWVTGPDDDFMSWLAHKPAEWLQQFYALLHDEAIQAGFMYRLKTLKIIRLESGEFDVASRSFFSTNAADAHFPTVDTKVYQSGKSKPQQEKARKFLFDLGVRELGDAEEVEYILSQRYTKEAEIPDEQTYLRDLERFIAVVERQPEKKSLFAPYYIFEGDDDQWHTPGGIYLDNPYQKTDLSSYYERMGDDADCAALNERYGSLGMSVERIGKFAQSVGAKAVLAISSRSCRDNPQWSHLRAVGGDRYTSSSIDRDYYIPKLGELLKAPSLELSRLIWRTIVSQPSSSQYLQATFQRNQKGGARYADSSLVHMLRAARWVPQNGGEFVRPADASRERLPKGFPFDAGWKSLNAIHFGAEAERRTAEARQKEAVAKSAGFSDLAQLELALQFVRAPKEEQERFFAEREREKKSAVPDRDLSSPDRRKQKIAEQAEQAPDKESEIRDRSVSNDRDVKPEAKQYLQQHYRNPNGDMTCQVCKGPLPFKLEDGSDFFEIVEFLPGLKKRHFQNYLALCPNHAAMYRYANGSKEIVRTMFEKLTGSELEVFLAQRDQTIYLSQHHIIDLNGVLIAEKKLSVEEGDESI